jgi:hypothetical protein
MGILLIAFQASCGGWTTRNSVKDDESDAILINLDRKGQLILGHGGVGREILESYMFSLRPIRPVYIDDEIKLTRTIPTTGPTTPVKGTISFNADYSRVKIDLEITKEARDQPFDGNGTYNINE